MVHPRRAKIGARVRAELSRLIRDEMSDPRVGFVTVTAVEVSRDLRVAHVYVSVMAGPSHAAETLAAFERGRGFLRRGLAGNLALRRTPELRFHIDTSADRAERIERLLDNGAVTRGPASEADETD